jgi:hypothetical protein
VNTGQRVFIQRRVLQPLTLAALRVLALLIIIFKVGLAVLACVTVNKAGICLVAVVKLLMTIGQAWLALRIKYIKVTRLAEAVNEVFMIGLALVAQRIKYIQVTRLAEAVNNVIKVGLALFALDLIQNALEVEYHNKLGLCMALVRRRATGYLIEVLEASQTFRGMVWGEVDVAKDRTDSMVRGLREVPFQSWSSQNCRRIQVHCNLETGFTSARRS